MTERKCKCGEPARPPQYYTCRACHASWMKLHRDKRRLYQPRHTPQEVIESLQDMANELASKGHLGASAICASAIQYIRIHAKKRAGIAMPIGDSVLECSRQITKRPSAETLGRLSPKQPLTERS